MGMGPTILWGIRLLSGMKPYSKNYHYTIELDRTLEPTMMLNLGTQSIDPYESRLHFSVKA